MNRRHRFSLSLAILALAAGTAAITPAGAQAQTQAPELSFYPAQAWNVSQAGSGCMVASQFNNGFILDFKGSGQQANILNIDFRQNVFQDGKNYDVTLTVPGVKTQSLQAQGASAQALAIALPDQADFYKALQSAAVLDVMIEHNNFRFYLTGFGKAAQAFEKCLDDTRIAAMPPEEQQYMVNEAMAMESDIDQSPMVVAADAAPPPAPSIPAASDGAEAVPYIDTTETRSLGGQPVNAAAFEDVPIAPTPHKRLSEELAEVIAEDPSLFATASAPIPDEREPVPRAPEPSFMTDMAEDAPPLEPAPEATKVVRSTTPQVKVTKESIKAEVDFTALDVVEPASADDTMDRGYDDMPLNAKISELQHKVNELQAENMALNDELKTTLKETEAERLSVTSENWDLERATMRFNEAERQIKRMGQELQSTKAKCDMEKKDIEAMLFDPNVTDKQQLAKLATLEEQLAKAREELDLQRMRYEERIRVIEAQRQ